MYNDLMENETPKPPPWVPAAKRLMAANSIRQEDLCEVFEVTTRGAVGHYFSGRRPAKEYQIRNLAQKLGTNICGLYQDIEQAPTIADPTAKYSAKASKLQRKTINAILSLNDTDLRPFYRILQKYGELDDQ